MAYQIDATEDRLVARYEAPLDLKLRIWILALLFLTFPVFGVVGMTMFSNPPTTRTIHCDRTFGLCTATAPWSHLEPEVFSISQLTAPTIFRNADGLTLYSSARHGRELTAFPLGPLRVKLLEQAAAQLQTFVASPNQSSVEVNFPMNSPDVGAFAFAGAIWVPVGLWFMLLRKRSVTWVLELDRVEGTARFRRSWTLFWRTHVEQLMDFVRVEDRKALLGDAGLTTSWLRFKKHSWPLLPAYERGSHGNGLEFGAYIARWIRTSSCAV